MDNELSFFEAWQILRNYKVLIITIPIGFALVSFILSKYIASSWEGEAIIQVGRVGTITNQNRFDEYGIDDSEIKSSLIESPDLLVARIMNKSKDKKSPLSSVKLRASRVKNTSLIKLEITSNSEAAAREVTLSTIAQLQEVQKPQLNYAVDFLKEKLTQTNENLREIQDEIQRIKEKFYRKNALQNDPIAPDMLLKNVYKEKKYLLRQKGYIEEQLSPAFTYPTRMLGNLQINESGISFKQIIIAILAFATGAFFTIAGVLVHHTSKVQKRN